MSLFTSIFLAMIVGMPILIWWQMNRHEYGYVRFGSLFVLICLSLFIYSSMAPSFEQILSIITVNETFTYTSNVTETYNSTETSADIMSMLNHPPENTSKYWDNDWVRERT